MDKIIKLLLKLSGLLARAENTIQGLNENTNEKIKVIYWLFKIEKILLFVS